MGSLLHHQRKNKIVVLLFLTIAAFLGTAAGVYLALSHDLPQIRRLEDFSPSGVTRIYDNEGTFLAELYMEKRDPIPYSRIPPMLVSALIVTEDRRFYSHSGIDLKGILRAAVKDIAAGEFVEGGSTITQQLAKTLFLTRRKNFLRKLKEALLAVQLERRYTKAEIIELYLNQVYLGSGIYGVKAAAQKFFNKRPDQLTVPECALIAGLPKAPSRLSPLVNKDLAIARRNTVLMQMRRHGIISQQEYEIHREAPLTTAPSAASDGKAPYFIEYIKPFLENAVGAGRLYRGRLSIYTTLSYPLQAAAESAVDNGLTAIEARMKQKGLSDTPQAALVALDVRTGGILAMVGGRDFNRSPFNRATSARRQPGSAFKPILYAYAVGHGFTPATPVLNTPAVFPGATTDRPWEPKNFSKTYSSEVTVRQALVHSLNLPAARVISRLGPASVADFAAGLGISSPLSPYLSLALGTSETTLMEITGAYSVFPRLGRSVKPYGVTRILDDGGRVLWQARPAPKQVLPATDAAVMTDMLRAVIREGTGRRAKDLPCPVAGKTGTTDNCKDALFIGFSQKTVAGVWTGTDNYSTLGKHETGAIAALPIWKEFMRRAMERYGCEDFALPDGLVRVRFDPVTGAPVSRGRPGVSGLFKKGQAPGDIFSTIGSKRKQQWSP